MSVATAAAPAGVRAVNPYGFRIAHRRLAWMFRISAVLNVALCGAVIFLASAFMALFPLTRVELALVKTDSADNQLVRIEPLSRDVNGYDILLENKVRWYVQNLLEIDSASQGVRMQATRKLASSDFAAKFYRSQVETGAIDKALADGLTRTIKIADIDMLQRSGDQTTWSVDFVQRDAQGGVPLAEKKVRATVVVAAGQVNEVPLAERYENPLGVQVLDVSLKERFND